MTVKDLINRLSQCDPEAQVTLEFTDHTDYLYFFDFKEGGLDIIEQDEAIVDVDENGDTIEGKSVTILMSEDKAFYGLG